jgi:hypothetical protein
MSPFEKRHPFCLGFKRSVSSFSIQFFDHTRTRDYRLHRFSCLSRLAKDARLRFGRWIETATSKRYRKFVRRAEKLDEQDSS